MKISKPTEQEKRWAGEFGSKYIKRNYLSIADAKKFYRTAYGVDPEKLNHEFLGKLDRSIKILEVGCNIGIQLALLRTMGFTNLYGVEINQDAAKKCRKINPDINIVQGSALDIPFKDGYFDLVFTAGVLIHISPRDVKQVMSEIHRCTKKYIWGWEYYADTYTEINYRGNKNMLWKGNFAGVYQDSFKDMRLIKQKKVSYVADNNFDAMFLLKKV